MTYNIFYYSIYYDFLNRFSNSYTKKIIIEAWYLFIKLYPYLILGIIITSILKLFLTTNTIKNFFKNNYNISIFISSFLGIISPLGSYIVIPLAAGLLSAGLSLPIIMSFLISSPLIDVNLFILTAGAFGYKMALARLISAFLVGIGAGYFFKFLIKKNIVNPFNVVNTYQVELQIDNYNNDNTTENKMHSFLKETFKMSKYICKYFLLAIVISAIIKILIPVNSITNHFSRNIFLSVVISTSAGIPFYTCGGAAIPVVKQLYDLGLPQGAILAFFISGPITKISNLIIFRSIFCNKLFILYIFYGIISAIIIGLTYNFII